MERVEELLDVLLSLPEDERLVVAAVAVDSVQEGNDDEAAAAWAEEARLRLQRLRRGEVSVIATEVVEQELDEIVASAGVGQGAAS